MQAVAQKVAVMADPKQVTIDQLGNFSIDDAGRLYWKNKVVQTESVVVLSSRLTVWAAIVAIATIISALATALYSGVYVYTTFKNPPAAIQQQNK
jgi:hypothetical protein